MINLGDTFLLPSPGGVPEHLWIVITERDAKHKAVCVNVTDEDKHPDKTTILRVGDHPFITKVSVIRYGKAAVTDLALVEGAIKNGMSGRVCAHHRSCSPELLKRVQEGILISIYTPKAIKALFRKPDEHVK